jgi:hypothetical protein
MTFQGISNQISHASIVAFATNKGKELHNVLLI